MQVTTRAQGTRTGRVAVESGEHSGAINKADEGLGARNGELRTATAAMDAPARRLSRTRLRKHRLTVPPHRPTAKLSPDGDGG